MPWWHFDEIAEDYAAARPPYPRAVFDALESAGVVGPGMRVLEIGAGAGLATRELTRLGCQVVALEPGADLSRVLSQTVPGVEVITARLEDVELPDGGFQSVVAATSMHWVDLAVGLPRIHACLRPPGRLAVWRTIYGDDAFDTEFRRRVKQIVSQRAHGGPAPDRVEDRPTMEELCAGGWFEPEHTHRWRWSIELSAPEVRRLFTTFSNWSRAEADAAGRAVDDLGGVVTEHYQTVLHLLRRVAVEPRA